MSISTNSSFSFTTRILPSRGCQASEEEFFCDNATGSGGLMAAAFFFPEFLAHPAASAMNSPTPTNAALQLNFCAAKIARLGLTTCSLGFSDMSVAGLQILSVLPSSRPIHGNPQHVFASTCRNDPPQAHP